ncbi:MAG: hypothetical protein IE923_12925 [Micrococcales bacterium]|nr:hypothetical protein [Micrococcales bacterium]
MKTSPATAAAVLVPTAGRGGQVRRGLAAAAVLAWVLGGCTPATQDARLDGGPPSPSPSVSPVESPELLAALASGEVGHDAYLAGFERFAACLSREGHEVVVHDDSGPVVDYSIPGAAVTSGAEEDCYAREFGPLDVAWQVAQRDTSEWARVARRCLEDRGTEPAGTVDEMEQQLADARITVDECVVG